MEGQLTCREVQPRPRRDLVDGSARVLPEPLVRLEAREAQAALVERPRHRFVGAHGPDQDGAREIVARRSSPSAMSYVPTGAAACGATSGSAGKGAASAIAGAGVSGAEAGASREGNPVGTPRGRVRGPRDSGSPSGLLTSPYARGVATVNRGASVSRSLLSSWSTEDPLREAGDRERGAGGAGSVPRRCLRDRGADGDWLAEIRATASPAIFLGRPSTPSQPAPPRLPICCPENPAVTLGCSSRARQSLVDPRATPPAALAIRAPEKRTNACLYCIHGI